MLGKIRKWYNGEFIAYENNPNSLVFFVGGYQKRHWASRAAHVVVDFWMKHWQWSIGTSLAVCGLLIAVNRYS